MHPLVCLLVILCGKLIHFTYNLHSHPPTVPTKSSGKSIVCVCVCVCVCQKVKTQIKLRMMFIKNSSIMAFKESNNNNTQNLHIVPMAHHCQGHHTCDHTWR